jgi:hypothetical protein
MVNQFILYGQEIFRASLVQYYFVRMLKDDTFEINKQRKDEWSAKRGNAELSDSKPGIYCGTLMLIRYRFGGHQTCIY